MPEPFVGEIRTFAFGFAPSGWAPCQGQLLPIAQHTTLFALIGNTYGGDGKSTFALPDLRGRVVLGTGAAPTGTAYDLGKPGGEEAHRLTEEELPAHRHRARGSTSQGHDDTPAGAVWAASNNRYTRSGPNTSMHAEAVAPSGGDEPHNTMQPYLPLTVCISLFGVFPQRP
jgi:microcystin-dependent protein